MRIISLLFISFKGLLGSLFASNLEGIIIAVLIIIMRPRDAKKFGNFKFFTKLVLYVLKVFTKNMDSFELNKIIAAVLLTALIVIGIGKFTDILFHVEKPKQSAYIVEGLEVAKATGSEETSEKVLEVVDIKALLAMGDLAHGEKVFKKMYCLPYDCSGWKKYDWSKFMECYRKNCWIS